MAKLVEQLDEVLVRQEWAGFNLHSVGGEKIMSLRHGDLVVLSGCITTTSPMKQMLWPKISRFGGETGRFCW